jgi:hypothetical protein
LAGFELFVRAAWVVSAVAVAFGVVAALIAIGSILWAALEPDDVSSAGVIVAKVTATLAAATIAAYAGRQSGRHREREELAKRLELQLVAFGPFIHGLDVEDQRVVRKEFVARAFTGLPVSDSAKRGLFGRKDDNFGVTPELVNAIATVLRSASHPTP